MVSKLQEILPKGDYEELKLAGLVQKIEGGDYMPPYLEWLSTQQPELTLTWSHIQYIGNRIQQIVDGDIKKLMVSLHPRIGKTTLVTLSLPSYLLSRNPKTKLILASYNQTLANKLSAKARSLTERAGVKLDQSRRAREEWATTFGGGLRAVGAITAGIAGYGADFILIDDPVRGRKDANSKTMQEALYDWYKSDIYTRLEKDAAIILIATRWNQADLFGRILETEGEYNVNNPNGWHVINLPALAEENDPLGRLPGDALCPDKFNVEQLLAIKEVLGNDFESLYQGRPTTLGGGMFKRNDFRFVDRLPKEETDLRFYRFWDKAVSQTGDYTVGCLIAYSKQSGNIYVVDVVRGKWETHDREQLILKIAREDNINYGHVRIGFEKEPGSSGEDSAQYSIKLLAGYSVLAIPSRKSKVVRAEPFSAQVQAGNVYLVKNRWIRDFLEELQLFPNAKHDDQVDAVSGAFNMAFEGMGFIKIGKGV